MYVRDIIAGNKFGVWYDELTPNEKECVDHEVETLWD